MLRALLVEFPDDPGAWLVEDEYMFGPDILVKPITDAGCTETAVYLPAGAKWTNAWTGEEYEGGQTVVTAAPIEQIPLFTKNEYKIDLK